MCRGRGSNGGVTLVVGRGGGCGVARVDGLVRAFSSTVTYGPFSRDYIQFSDLTRKRRLGSRQAGWPRLRTPIGATRFVPSEMEKRISPIFSLAKISSPV